MKCSKGVCEKCFICKISCIEVKTPFGDRVEELHLLDVDSQHLEIHIFGMDAQRFVFQGMQ